MSAIPATSTPQPTPPPAKPPLGRVAVVAIHGVSDQKPFETANAIANLLLNINRNEKPQTQYAPFAEEQLRISVRPLRLNDNPPNPSDAGHKFMRDLVSDYQSDGPDASYETIRLRGARLDDAGVQREVDIYEMYWADLSRLGTGIIDVFGELGQILFHLSDLGQTAIDAASRDNPLPWRACKNSRRLANAILTLFIPVLNLYMLLIGMLTLLVALPPDIIPATAAVIAGPMLLAAGLTLAYRWMPPSALLLLLLITFAAAASFALWHLPQTAATTLLALEAALAAFALAIWLLGRYANRKSPGLRRIFHYQTAAVAIIFLTCLTCSLWSFSTTPVATTAPAPAATTAPATAPAPAIAPASRAVATAALWTVELIFAVLAALWCCFSILSSLGVIAGGMLARAQAPHHPAARSAIITGWITLAIPAVTFLFLIIGIDAALLRVLGKLLENMDYQPLALASYLNVHGTVNARVFINSLLEGAGTSGLALMCALMLLGIIVLFLGFFPAFWTDVFTPKNQKTTRRLGRWLNGAFSASAVTAACFVIATIGMAPAIVCQIFHFNMKLGDLTPALISAMAILFAGTATGFITFRGRLQALALGFRPAIDALLDVDNHLREFPRDANPRARIAARCASLFRYLQRWQDPRDKSPYSAIVIIAHSQGTVIAVETLRFARFENVETLVAPPDQPASGIPAVLFTMGCPLRQLYAWRFPHIYAWAANGPDILFTGLTLWINAYRSGDYVGRALWKKDNGSPFRAGQRNVDHGPWLARPIPRPVSPTRDLCIGAGAHTHYWDRTAESIALQLDQLIAQSP